jgi:hypothetical protein
MKKLELVKADFVTAANALTNESFNGNVHVDICEGLSDLDPYIGDYAPVFFMYTFYAHLNMAQMYAAKLFDTDPRSFTVERFLEIVRLRSSTFPHAEQKEVLECIADAEKRIRGLHKTLKVLRNNRNKFLAHISKELVFERSKLQQAANVTLPQIREVLYAGGGIVNDFLRMWNRSTNQLRETHRGDYKKIVSLVSNQLCAEIKAREAEFAAHGLTRRISYRPRDCE